MERTITVKGTGRLKAAPDRIEIALTIRTKNKVYAEAVEDSSKLLSSLREALLPAGFTEDDLKSTGFFVRSEYEGVRDRNGEYRQVFSGYVCEHMLMLRFPFDTDRLSETLTAITRCLAEPELNISFTVAEKERLAGDVLKRAVADAKERAAVIAEASGVKIVRVLSVNHGAAQHNFVSPTAFGFSAKRMANAVEEDCVDMQISPESVSVSDTVDMVFEIE
ncbi:MAG: SIMPL domain-containing protein [Clostridiales bacterium]|nr:SIMPL domain-containing protein [Clostridiales bacterium]